MTQRTKRTQMNGYPAILVLCTGLLLSGALCDNLDPDPGFKNYDRISDAVLLTPPNQEAPAHSFLLSTNPAYEQIRIYDTYRRRFVEADNVYFPLSINTGPATLEIAAPSEDASFLFAFDVQWNQVFVIRTTATEAERAFSHVGDGFSVEPGAQSLETLPGLNGETYVYLTYPSEQLIRQYTVDENGVLQGNVTTISLTGTTPEHLHRLDEISLAMTSYDDHRVFIIRPFENDVVSIPLIQSAAQITSGYLDLGQGEEQVLIATLSDGHTLAAIARAPETSRRAGLRLLGYTELQHAVGQVYIPDNRDDDRQLSPRVCCPLITYRNNTSEPFLKDEATKAWATVFHNNGTMSYLRLDGPRYGQPEDAIQTLFRPLDINDEIPGPTETFIEEPIWRTPDGQNNSLPLIDWMSIDNFGDTPYHGLRHLGRFIHLTWNVQANGEPTSSASFTVYDSELGHTADAWQDDSFIYLERPGLRIRISLANQGSWAPGTTLTIPLAADVTPLTLDIAAFNPASRNALGFGATLPTQAVGGEINILTNSNSEPTAVVRRIFVTTEAGQIMEMNETETNLIYVIGPRSI